jgi:S-DNA-T family DNA segregation ATPase FtsK/SpoIIIE
VRSAPRLQNPPRAKWSPSRSMRAVHFQVGGVLLVALGAILGWNTLAAHSDGVLPRYGVWLLRQTLGSVASLVPLAISAFGVLLIVKGQRARSGAFWRGALLAFAVFAALRHLGVPRGDEFQSAQTLQTHGGLIGAALSWTLRRVLGEVGTYIALIALGLASLLLWSEGTLGELGGQIGEKWADLRHKWSQGKQAKQKPKPQTPPDESHLQPDEEDESSFEPQPRPQTPRARNGNSSRQAARSPFLEVGDWFGGEEKTLPQAAPQPQAEPKAAPRSRDLDEDFPVAPEPATEEPEPQLEAPQPKPANKPKAQKPELEAPRIEIIQAELPPSVLDLNQEQDEVLLPHEALELQALESAQSAADIPKPRPRRIEKPRRRFGDGPLMPEYFDDGVRALDPPVLPDLEGAEEELQRGVIGVQETLAAFKIDARVTDVKRGPVITRYEVQPAPGVRVAAIANLDKDLARSLSALAVRIEAPVPGKNVVGIEVPNKRVHLVRMRDVLEQSDFLSHPSQLAFVLGKDIAGQPKWGDLAKMPHLLIAGSTNSGKSVCLNSIIASILVRASPEEVRFSLIDPKRVELTLYRGIPHLMHDVVVEPKQAVIALRRAIEEMDRRYRLFANRGVRNIASYNSKLQAGERPMPYIVIVIDELADLMMTAAAEFEKLICRLAQLARATGIHLIVATQRPSVNVITGVIKANIPARIAFAVASQVDSRTILDSVGAERLIGSGDMLFDANNGGKSTRIQGAYLSEEEVNRIVEVVKANYAHEDAVPDDLPTFDLFVEDESDEDDAKSGGFSSDEKRDSLYDDIVEFALRHNEMSASNIQRKFGIGYPRAGRIVDQLERAGILGPADGPKPRKVLGRGDSGGSSNQEEE